MTITHIQLRAARALLGLGSKEVMDAVDIKQTPFNVFENTGKKISKQKADTLAAYYQNRGAKFIDNEMGVGVILCDEGDKVYKGKDGFILFMEDVYQTIKRLGGEICVSNVDERNWIKWMGEDVYAVHKDKMNELDNFNFKITIKEGDDFFIASGIAEYRWLPADKYNSQSCYAYGNKMANIDFSNPDDVTVSVLTATGSADGFRNIFGIAWDSLEVANK